MRFRTLDIICKTLQNMENDETSKFENHARDVPWLKYSHINEMLTSFCDQIAP